MYALSFYGFFLVMKRQKMSEKEINTLLIFTVIWVILWGRIGYVLLYNFSYYRDHLVDVLKIWQGGMSFHGGAIGVILAWYWAARKMQVSFLQLSDKFVWIVPFGLLLGRIGNYINGELFGLPGYRWFGARLIEGVSYFPTPLLEGVLEGAVLGFILYWKRDKIQYPGQLGVWFLGGYGIARFWAEFFREPDAQVGYILSDWMSLGHILSITMILISLTLHFVLRKRKA
jgi:phosphatidylglycerol---prolipoprotein diacylglyceryl transferase